MPIIRIDEGDGRLFLPESIKMSGVPCSTEDFIEYYKQKMAAITDTNMQ